MRRYGLITIIATVAGLLALSAPSALAQGTGGEQPPTGIVSSAPASGTPQLNPADDSPTQQIRQIAQCGNTMYAVGSFWDIKQGSSTFTRNNIMSWSATKPYTLTSWAPDVE